MRFYFASIDGNAHGLEMAKRGLIGNAFTSYWNVARGAGHAKRMAIVLKKCRSVIVDSGAHSFFSEAGTGGVHRRRYQKQELDPETYMAAYLAWLKANPGFDYFAELDIGELVGQETVYRWRKDVEAAGLADKMITVLHPVVETMARWKRGLDRCASRYIALEGIRGGRQTIRYNDYLRVAFEAGIRVHGFAMGHKKMLRQYPFYSVDSSSWIAGARWGVVHGVDEVGRIVNISKSKGAKSKAVLAAFKLAEDPEGVMNNASGNRESIARCTVSIEAHLRNEAYWTRYWNSRGVNWQEQLAKHGVQA